MAQQNKLTVCPICKGSNTKMLDEAKNMIECFDCYKTTRPLQIEKTSVTVVVPTRNESANITKLIHEIKNVSKDYNVLVVDDSNDNDMTKSLALASGAKVLDGQRKGLGQAIIDGLKASKSDVTVVMDADFSHPISKIPELVEACQNGYQMAVGSRYVKGGGIVGWTPKRKLISKVASFMAIPVSGIHDNTSGFFAVSHSLLDGADIKPSSWKIMLEILVKTKAKVKEVPITFKDRELGKSKFNQKETIAYLKHLFQLMMWRFRILNFMIVGGIGYIVNMGLYYPLTSFFKDEVTFLGQHFYLPPFVISSAVAIFCNYELNKRWTFGDMKAKSLSILRYYSMAGVTLLLDMVLLFMFVDFGKMTPMLAAALAIAIAFILRYVISKAWIWKSVKS